MAWLRNLKINSVLRGVGTGVEMCVWCGREGEVRHACLANGRFPDVFGREGKRGGCTVGEWLWDRSLQLTTALWGVFDGR